MRDALYFQVSYKSLFDECITNSSAGIAVLPAVEGAEPGKTGAKQLFVGALPRRVDEVTRARQTVIPKHTERAERQLIGRKLLQGLTGHARCTKNALFFAEVDPVHE